MNQTADPADRDDVNATSQEPATPDATFTGPAGSPEGWLAALASLVTALTALAVALLGDAPWRARLFAFVSVQVTIAVLGYFVTHPG